MRPPYGSSRPRGGHPAWLGYVSRLLDALEDDALVERSKRGRVESLEIAGLLRRWTEDYDVFRSNATTTLLAPRGASDALTTLGSVGESTPTAVSGSFAAIRYAPIAAPALLIVYSDTPTPVAEAVDAIPADSGSNVVVLRPFDPVVWDRTIKVDSVRYVAPSQVVADCLTGNGRMPSEGEALLEWMLANESEWRLDALPEIGGTGD